MTSIYRLKKKTVKIFIQSDDLQHKNCPSFSAHSLANAVHLTDVQIPEFVDIRDIVTLSCSYRMGRNQLNSVKWYKDGDEFFR